LTWKTTTHGDLTNRDTLKTTSLDSPGVIKSTPYKIIKNVIVLPFPEASNITARYKITELTVATLKLTMHVRVNYNGDKIEYDLIELVFEKEK